MPKLVFEVSEINNYLKQSKEHCHQHYEEAVSKCNSLAVHADGNYPKDLIEERRPNEPLEVKTYREKIWKPKTKPVVNKVLNELQKIRRSSDWSIRYDLEKFTKVREGESLEDYCEKNLPYFGSVTNWAFSILLRKNLIDPNGLVFVRPEEMVVPANEFLKPVIEIYGSELALDFVPEDYAVLRDPLGSSIYYNKGKKENGAAIYIVTTEKILKYEQYNSRGDFKLTLDYNHELGILPVRKLRGVLVQQTGKYFLYESRIAGMVPELDEAVREYSDLQASKVLHIYAERWEFTQNECTTCKGTGRRRNPLWINEQSTCSIEIDCDAPGCNRGYIAAGPYSKLLVRPMNAIEGQNKIPNPPAGYIEKDVEIVKIQGEGVREHIYNALSAINFEFLAESPLAQSGVAKAYDADALNNTVHSIAEDIVSIMDDVYKYIAYYRYKTLYAFSDIDEMLPKIPVPEKFDILTSTRTLEEISSSKTNKANPIIISALEVDYAAKRFNNDPEVRDGVMLVLELDPLPNISEEDKMTRLSNKGITLETYVISSNIQAFIERAIVENENFPKLKKPEQQKILIAYAQEVIKANSPATDIIDTAIGVQGAEGGQNNGQNNGVPVPPFNQGGLDKKPTLVNTVS